MKLEQAIKQINNFSDTVISPRQKELAIKILQESSQEDISELFNFIFQRIKLGFRFDFVPQIAKGQISLVQELKELNINTKKEVVENENKLIIGENYDALKNLLLTHKNKIDVIYIDPPYNTEAAKNEGNYLTQREILTGGGALKPSLTKNKFRYWDKFSRTGWLNLIFSRLKLAKDLLTEDGIIFVSIDDNEQAYLKVIMDEIFGEEHFLKTLIWRTNSSVMKNSKDFRKDHEYIHVYSQEPGLALKKLESNWKFENPDNDPKGPWINTNATKEDNVNSPNHYPIKRPNGTEITKTWRFSRSDYESGKVTLLFKDNNVPRLKIYKKDQEEKEDSKTPATLLHLDFLEWDKKFSFTTSKNQLSEILGPNSFDTPKHVDLIMYLIERVNKKDCTVLDFFAGSGTTAHSVLRLNKKDKGNRKFILVTNDENEIAEKVCYERLYRIIQKTATNDQSWNLDKKFNDFYPNTKLRVFELQKHNVKLGTNINDLGMDAIKELKKLNPDFKSDNEDIYYRLSSLLQD